MGTIGLGGTMVRHYDRAEGDVSKISACVLRLFLSPQGLLYRCA